MCEKSIERYQIFKEEIREKLHSSEDYMFSDKKNNNNKNNSQIDINNQLISTFDNNISFISL